MLLTLTNTELTIMTIIIQYLLRTANQINPRRFKTHLRNSATSTRPHREKTPIMLHGIDKGAD